MSHSHDPSSGGFAGGMVGAILAILLVAILVVLIALWQPWATDAGGGVEEIPVPTPASYHYVPAGNHLPA